MRDVAEMRGFDLAAFRLPDMIRCTSALRELGAVAASRTEAAERIVRYLFERLVDGATGEPALALVRCFATSACKDLPLARRRLVEDLPDDMRCLTLLASAGVEPDWNDPERSREHRVIPLPSEDAVRRSPMIAQMIRQLGLDVGDVVRSDPDGGAHLAERSYNVFHVPEAPGSEAVPAQDGFVLRYGISSVLGFGGVLPGATLFAVIMFSKVPISREVADLFVTVALSAKLALLAAAQPTPTRAG